MIHTVSAPLRILTAACLIALAAPTAFADTLNVPGDYTSIRKAVLNPRGATDATGAVVKVSPAGDELLVTSGLVSDGKGSGTTLSGATYKVKFSAPSGVLSVKVSGLDLRTAICMSIGQTGARLDPLARLGVGSTRGERLPRELRSGSVAGLPQAWRKNLAKCELVFV